jgi:hypothetical protein
MLEHHGSSWHPRASTPLQMIGTTLHRYDMTSNLCSADFHLELDVTSSYDGLTYRPLMDLAENTA